MVRGQSRGGWRNEAPRRPPQHPGGNQGFRPWRPHKPGVPGPPRFPHHFHNRPQYRPHNGPPRSFDLYRGSHDDRSPPMDRSKHYWNNRPNNYQNNKFTLNQHRHEFSNMQQYQDSDESPHNSSTNFMSNSQQSFFLSQTSSQPHFDKNFNVSSRIPPNISSESLREDYRNIDEDMGSHSFLTRSREREIPHGGTSKCVDYGARPSSSDYYESNTSTADDSSCFSRSVNDTVSIIKQRLLNRHNLSHESSLDQSTQNRNNDDKFHHRSIEKATHSQQESIVKKRINRNRPKISSINLKNKIVNQLFKMDKDTIHKLMDNPNSSAKFEFAINSLITESHNSLNKHIRADAERSLYGSSSDHYQYNENDTLYEDTFMKQMQCVLDPKETIILTDLKPIVMAEINRVLQLDECHQGEIMPEHDGMLSKSNENVNNYHKSFVYDNLEGEFDYPDYANEHKPHHSLQNTSEDITTYGDTEPQFSDNEYTEDLDIKLYNDIELHSSSTSEPVLDQSNSRKLRHDYNREKRLSADKRRNSANLNDETLTSPEPSSNAPLFDIVAGTEALSGDDDPFDELDKQYHVAVDPNFLKIDDPGDIEFRNENAKQLNNKEYGKEQPLQKTDFHQVKVKLGQNQKSPVITPKKEKHVINMSPEMKVGSILVKGASLSVDKTIERKDNDSSKRHKSSSSKSSRKRSLDEQPSHRKEKLKKSNSVTIDKNETCIIDSNHSDVKNATHSAPRHEKGTRRSNSNNISYSDKFAEFVKTKESSGKISKSTDHDPTKRSRHISIHSNLSSDENASPSKHDSKSKFKTFDMFEQKPKKVQVHQAHRNTAVVTSHKSEKHEKETDIKTHKSEKLNQKSVSTQVKIFRKMVTKETQTTINKCQKSVRNKSTQTEINSNESQEKPNVELLKEIDAKINFLLQEKLKLCNTENTRELLDGPVPTFGVTVLNVPQFHENEGIILSETMVDDSLIEKFATLNEEELEQLALEGVQNTEIVTELPVKVKPIPKKEKRKVTKGVTKKSKFKAKTGKKTADRKTFNRESTSSEYDDPSDLITLEDLKVSPVKTRGARHRLTSQSSYNQVDIDSVNFKILSTLKPCSVALVRLNLSDLVSKKNNKVETKVHHALNDNDVIVENVNVTCVNKVLEEIDQKCEDVGVEYLPELNEYHIQDDMMLIQQDIVIDEEHGISERDELSVSDEIVLDNSCKPSESVASTSAPTESHSCDVFDFSSDEELRKDSITVSGNTDAVLAIECVDQNFLAACLDGNVYYFNGEGHLLTTLRGSNFAVTCMSIVENKHATTVYTGSLDSRIRHYDLQSGMERGSECNVLSPIQSMDQAWDTIFVGTGTGFVLQFECKNNMLIPVSTIKFSEQSILALRALKEGPRKVLLVAARSENVTIKDAQTGLLLRTLLGPKMTVYTLLYEAGKIFCGTSSQHVQVFDYATGNHIGEHEGGKGAVCLRAAGSLVFAGCYDGCVYVFRPGRREPFAQLRGPPALMLSLAVIGSKIIAGYKDRSLYIWKIPFSILQEMIF